MQNILQDINLKIQLHAPNYKLKVEEIIEDVVYEIVNKNSIHEGYYNKAISKKELLEIYSNLKDNEEKLFNVLREYAKI